MDGKRDRKYAHITHRGIHSLRLICSSSPTYANRLCCHVSLTPNHINHRSVMSVIHWGLGDVELDLAAPIAILSLEVRFPVHKPATPHPLLES